MLPGGARGNNPTHHRVAGFSFLEPGEATRVSEARQDPQESVDPIDRLERAIDQTGRIVDGLRPDQANVPTPCAGWDVKDLAQHVVRDLRMFTARAAGEAWEDQTPSLDPDQWNEAYRTSADQLIDEWRDSGPLDEVIELPFGKVPRAWFVGQQLSDVIVHGWDLARSTGQAPRFDDDAVVAALEWGRANLRPEYRGKDFGPQVEVPEDAPALDRLVGFFGRDPSWVPRTS
jgi:uncharacterized protein (TIGR03086 family)